MFVNVNETCERFLHNAIFTNADFEHVSVAD